MTSRGGRRSLAAVLAVLAGSAVSCERNPVGPGSSSQLAVISDIEGDLVLVQLDGSGQRKLAEGAGDPFWTPDGQQILFSRWAFEQRSESEPPTRENHIYAVDLNGRIRRLVAAGGPVQEELNARPSPDGRWIYFSGYPGGVHDGYGVWRVSASGGVPVHVGPPAVPRWAGIDRVLGVSPDGERVLFESPRSGRQRLAVLTVRTGEVAEISESGPSAVWSPRTDQIAYIAYAGHHIRIIRPDGQLIREIPNSLDAFGGFHLFGGLSWSPDGRFLIARAMSDMLLVDPRSGKVSRLPGLQTFYDPAWGQAP